MTRAKRIEEESEVGWILRPVGSRHLHYPVYGRGQADKHLRWFEDHYPHGSRMEIVRVRITVEGEESER